MSPAQTKQEFFCPSFTFPRKILLLTLDGFLAEFGHILVYSNLTLSTPFLQCFPWRPCNALFSLEAQGTPEIILNVICFGGRLVQISAGIASHVPQQFFFLFSLGLCKFTCFGWLVTWKCGEYECPCGPLTNCGPHPRRKGLHHPGALMSVYKTLQLLKYVGSFCVTAVPGRAWGRKRNNRGIRFLIKSASNVVGVV